MNGRRHAASTPRGRSSSRSSASERLRIAGTQFDDGPRITRINDFRVDMQPSGTFLVVTHQDRPGVIAAISTLLARNDVNIAGIELGRDRPRGHAVMLMEIDDPVSLGAARRDARDRRCSTSSARCGSEALRSRPGRQHAWPTSSPSRGRGTTRSTCSSAACSRLRTTSSATAKREELYGRDMRNIVRVDDGSASRTTSTAIGDRYTRAASFLKSWLDLGVLVRDDSPGFYVVDHHFPNSEGGERRRRGVLAHRRRHRVGAIRPPPARADDERPEGRPPRAHACDARPDEPRLRDVVRRRRHRRRCSRTTRPGTHCSVGGSTASSAPRSCSSGGCRTRRSVGGDRRRRSAMPALRRRRASSLRDRGGVRGRNDARRIPTRPPDAPFERMPRLPDRGATIPGSPSSRPTGWCDPGPGIAFSLDDLWARLDDAYETEPAPSARAALARAAELRATHHAFAVVAQDGAAVLSRPRRTTRVAPRRGSTSWSSRPRCSVRRGSRADGDRRRGADVHARCRPARRGGARRRGGPRLRRHARERRRRSSPCPTPGRPCRRNRRISTRRCPTGLVLFEV